MHVEFLYYLITMIHLFIFLYVILSTHSGIKEIKMRRWSEDLQDCELIATIIENCKINCWRSSNIADSKHRSVLRSHCCSFHQKYNYRRPKQSSAYFLMKTGSSSVLEHRCLPIVRRSSRTFSISDSWCTRGITRLQPNSDSNLADREQ